MIYEVYVDKFAGNFTNLISKLDYLVELGVGTIWLLPHYPSPGVDGGYDISDYRGIRSDLGTLENFREFIKAAHLRGLKVITDMVLNHTSDQHPWFKDASSSRDNPKRNWYIWNDNPYRFHDAFVHFPEIKKTGNWIRNNATGDYYYATFYPQQPDLNWDNSEVVAEMLSTMDYWLELGVDGFRLDAISRLAKRDGTNCFALPETHAMLRNIRSHISTKFPDAVLLAESGGWLEEARTFFGNNDECHLVINFPLAVRMLSAVRHHDQSVVVDVWRWAPELPGECKWAAFLTNHDTVDLFFLTNDSEKQEVASYINPDSTYSQPNSSSVAARLAQVCRGKKEDIIWATEQLMSQPAVPIIYYGNEIGMPNQSLSQRPSDAREYVRGAFDWAEAERQRLDPDSLFHSVRKIIQKRRN